MLKYSLTDGFIKYYNTMISVGSVSKKELRSIFISSVIYRLISGYYGNTLSEEDYNALNSLVICLSGKCLVPYNTYCNSGKVNIEDLRLHQIHLADSSGEYMADMYLSNIITMTISNLLSNVVVTYNGSDRTITQDNPLRLRSGSVVAFKSYQPRIEIDETVNPLSIVFNGVEHSVGDEITMPRKDVAITCIAKFPVMYADFVENIATVDQLTESDIKSFNTIVSTDILGEVTFSSSEVLAVAVVQPSGSRSSIMVGGSTYTPDGTIVMDGITYDTYLISGISEDVEVRILNEETYSITFQLKNSVSGGSVPNDCVIEINGEEITLTNAVVTKSFPVSTTNVQVKVKSLNNQYSLQNWLIGSTTYTASVGTAFTVPNPTNGMMVYAVVGTISQYEVTARALNEYGTVSLTNNTTHETLSGTEVVMTVDAGTSVTIANVSTNRGYEFDRWVDGDDVDISNTTFIVESNKTCIAKYTAAQAYDLTFEPNNPDYGSVELDTEFPAPFYFGDILTFRIQANEHYEHNNNAWIDPNNNNVTFEDGKLTIDENVPTSGVYKVNFTAKNYTINASVEPIASGGHVSGVGQYPYGTSNVALAATTANQHFSFSHWDNDQSDTTNPKVITVLGDASYVAHFDEEAKYPLTASSGGHGTVKTTVNKSYYVGSQVTLQVLSVDEHYEFSHWMLNGNEVENSTATMTITTEAKVMNYVAVFVAVTPDVYAGFIEDPGADPVTENTNGIAPYYASNSAQVATNPNNGRIFFIFEKDENLSNPTTLNSLSSGLPGSFNVPDIAVPSYDRNIGGVAYKAACITSVTWDQGDTMTFTITE